MNSRQVLDIEYQLLPGTARKTTDIVIERNGAVIVHPSRNLSPDDADAVVHSKRHWIYRNLAEWRDLNATAVIREWVNGETFLYLGRSYRLSLVDSQDVDLKLKEGRFCLSRDLIDKSGTSAAKLAFEAYYSESGLRRITARVAYFAPKVGVDPSGIQIRDLGYRWATCNAEGVLSFHWKCMMARPSVIDYLVVHELCHLRLNNHSDAFWNEVDKILPDYQARKSWLRKYGAALDI